MSEILTLPTDHSSPSQVGMALKCGEQFRQRYVEGVRLPPRAAMLTGSGVHKGAEARNRQRMDDDTEMPRDDVIDLSVSAFDERVEEEGLAEEPGRSKADVEGEGRDNTRDLAGGFADLVAPQIMSPVAVEQRFEIEVESLGINLVNILDVVQIDEGLVVLEDLKCGNKKHGQDAVDASLQLTWGAMSWRHANGQFPDHVGLRSLRKLKRGPAQDLVTGTRNDDDVAKLLRVIGKVCRTISAGVFMPASPDAWWCSPDWCGYWGRCRYRGGK